MAHCESRSERLVFFEHHFGRFDDYRNLVPLLETELFALRRVITLSIWFFPILTTTWAMMSPSVTSTTFPSSWFRADIGMF